MAAFRIGPTPARHSVWPFVLGAVVILGIGMWALDTGRAWVNLTMAGLIVAWRVLQGVRARARQTQQDAAEPDADGVLATREIGSVQPGDLHVDEHPRRAGAGEDA